jgi:hypothetical protein
VDVLSKVSERLQQNWNGGGAVPKEGFFPSTIVAVDVTTGHSTERVGERDAVDKV